ncbi:MAG: hypothetical protein V1720_22480 [bacterium]
MIELSKKNWVVLILLSFTLACNKAPNEPDSNQHDVEYLGVAAPSNQSIVFKPDSVCTGNIELGMAVHPNLEEFYFTRLNNAFEGTIFASKKNNDEWTNPEPAVFSGTYNDTDPFITTDGNYLYFTSDRPLQNGSSGNKPHIWFVTKIENGWSAPQPVYFKLQSRIGESSPSLTSSGTLYFIANFSTLGGEGLYRSEFVDGKFKDPEYCSVLKNSNGIVEVEPFISSDETFILFYSAGRNDNYTPNGQIGDVYIAFRNNDNTWGDPKNLGSAVNTSGEESHPTLTPDGKYFFFARNVGRDNGFVDIFWIDAGFLKSFK